MLGLQAYAWAGDFSRSTVFLDAWPCLTLLKGGGSAESGGGGVSA